MQEIYSLAANSSFPGGCLSAAFLLIPRQKFAMQTFATPLKRGITAPTLRKSLIDAAICLKIEGMESKHGFKKVWIHARY